MITRRATLLLLLLCGLAACKSTESDAMGPGWGPIVPVAPPAARDAEGFRQIFDGQTLAGWDGDPIYWDVANGAIRGQITPQTLVRRNTFLIWRAGELEDFELKVRYRITKGGNSGINYRSAEVPGVAWAMRGYQADIEGGERWTGQNYEERGRKFLAYRGESAVIQPDGRAVTEIGDRAELNKLVKMDDWNEYHLVVVGNRMRHYVNGTLMSEVIDNDAENRAMAGQLGVQVHVGPPMVVEYQSILLKRLALEGRKKLVILPVPDYKSDPEQDALGLDTIATSLANQINEANVGVYAVNLGLAWDADPTCLDNADAVVWVGERGGAVLYWPELMDHANKRGAEFVLLKDLTDQWQDPAMRQVTVDRCVKAAGVEVPEGGVRLTPR